MYYESIPDPAIDPITLKRPRKQKKLPAVLSILLAILASSSALQRRRRIASLFYQRRYSLFYEIIAKIKAKRVALRGSPVAERPMNQASGKYLYML